MDTLGKSLEELPYEVLYLVIASSLNRLVGTQAIESARSLYPEYFQEEIEREKKWAAVPESVNQAFLKECDELHDKLFKDTPGYKKGLFYWIEHQKEFHSPEMESLWEEERRLKREIFNKHYSAYGFNR